MKNITLCILVSVSILASISGCKKDIYGCTDFAAYNFNQAATINNGSCLYEGTLTFFFFNPTYSNIIVSINGHTDTTTQCFPSGPPTCGAAGCANFLIPAGTYTYTARSAQKTWGITTPDTAIVTANQCALYVLN